MRLNGWQHLWILLSEIYGLGVSIFSVMVFLGSSEYDQQRFDAYLNSVLKYNKVCTTLTKAGFSQKEINEYISKETYLNDV